MTFRSTFDRQYNVLCPTHQAFSITNICTLRKCCEPLCPECIHDHIVEHSKRSEIPDIQNVLSVRIQQADGTMNNLDILRKMLSKYEPNTSSYAEYAMKKLRDAKAKVLEIVEQVFNDHEKLIKARINASSELFQTDQIEREIKKLEQLLVDFNSDDYVRAILYTLDKQCGSKDYRPIKDIEEQIRNYESSFGDIRTDDSYLDEIKQNIQGYLTLRKMAQKKVQFIVEDIQQQPEEPASDKKKEPDLISQLVGTLQNRVYLGSPEKPEFRMPQFASEPEELIKTQQFNSIHEPITIKKIANCPANPLIISFYDDQKAGVFYVFQQFLSQNEQKQIVEFQMDIEQRLPYNHCCVLLGTQIFIIGGIERDQDRTQALSTVYKVNLKLKTLQSSGNMVHRRQGCGGCSVGDKLVFVCGGSSTDSEQDGMNSMERFDIQTNRWTPMQPCKYACVGCCLINVNNTYIVKMGGINQEFEELKVIEIYNIRRDMWTTLSVFDKNGNQWKEIPCNAGGVQINESEIMIFGGEVNEHKTDDMWVVTLDIQNDIRSSSVRRGESLPFAGDVRGPIVVHQSSVYAFLNYRQEKVSMSGVKKILIECNGGRWKHE